MLTKCDMTGVEVTSIRLFRSGAGDSSDCTDMHIYNEVREETIATAMKMTF